MVLSYLATQAQTLASEASKSGMWDALLGNKSQTLAAWVYTLVTGVVLVLVFKQVVAMREAGELSAFETFRGLWEDEEMRESRRVISSTFGPAVNEKDEIKQRSMQEQILGTLQSRDSLRKDIDRVISRSNLVGALWTEGLLTASFRNKFIGYIYKTAIIQWDCLLPYITAERAKRETQPNSIMYAVPFERLKKEAEKRLGDGIRPRPTY